ncbi:hypothetical protein CDD82_7187 [Ophiocordyceps australis]|uniref:RNA helicase n=1 Tax=Ophiocordyceps australis TaxID=1399860 RepID=A0A2C5Y2B5_9HYPO|nr:hypothetical protein CDD82_7187 [Ophiocordyceps australis]
MENSDQVVPTNIPGWVQSETVDYTVSDENAAQTWDGNQTIYQWDDEYGDVGPKFPDLEKELFGVPENRLKRTGLDFSKIAQIEVQQEGPVKIDPIVSFKDAGLHPLMLENVQLSGYVNPTPIQKFTIPSILQGHDVIGIAQTGSGKTAAYLIPILSKLMGKAKKLAAPRPNPATFVEGRDEIVAEPLVLIIVPTRELAVQIFNEARKFCYRTMLRPGVVYGGTPILEQFKLLSRGCDILVGTPGRLVDILQRGRILTLRRLKYMIIDEADEMLDFSWDEALNHILAGSEQDAGSVKFGLFSATFPKEARELAKKQISASHVRFRVGRAGSTTENIQQNIILATDQDKRQLLVKLLEDIPGVRTIIFVNSRQAVDSLDDFLFNLQLPVTSLHSDRTQVEREAALRSFRKGAAPILVATGVMARGIDIQNVMHVINFDLPSIEHGGIQEYTHRIGRTGRIGHRGIASSLFDEERDESLGSVLVRTLMETNQPVPDFLQHHMPQGTEDIKFETESDFDPDEYNMESGTGGDGDAGGNAWGGGEDAASGEVTGGNDDCWAASAKPTGW